jgi:hypothetical protein
MMEAATIMLQGDVHAVAVLVGEQDFCFSPLLTVGRAHARQAQDEGFQGEPIELVRATFLHMEDPNIPPEHLANSSQVCVPPHGRQRRRGAQIFTPPRNTRAFQRQLLPRTRANKSSTSVIRYRVTDYKPQEVAKLPFEFDSSIRTIRFEPSTLAIAELVDPQVKAVVHHSMSASLEQTAPGANLNPSNDLPMAAFSNLEPSVRPVPGRIMVGVHVPIESPVPRDALLAWNHGESVAHLLQGTAPTLSQQESY